MDDLVMQTLSAPPASISEEADRLMRLARTATALSGDDAVERAASKVASKAREDEAFFKATASQISEMVQSIQARVDAVSAESGSAAVEEGAVGEAAELFQQLGQATDDLAQAEAAVKATIGVEEQRVRQVLSEHDYIQRLLRGAGKATDKQFDVLAFPRSAKAKTNVLHVSGGAGTGKTLCLLAKLIQDTRPSAQLGLMPEEPKRGLFVCFNTALRSHVQALLSAIPDADRAIEVVSYDQFINQLVRSDPSDEFAHLTPFARQSRYPSASADAEGRYWNLVYDADIKAAVARAMQTVSTRYPDRAKKYYLQAANEENVAWVSDEIAWLEARYADPASAAELYPGASRKGRGGSRLPSSDIRRIILEVWTEFQKVMEREHQYTIEQATKRLLADPNLPRYDAIAVDEVQDLTVASVKLLVRLRADEHSRVYICGDENQKIYKRDFTWKELGADVSGWPISLDENKRNSPSIEAFANRLLGVPSAKELASDHVFLGTWTEGGILDLIARIRAACPEETVAVISGDLQRWFSLTRDRALAPVGPRQNGVVDPGLYVLGARAGKGLEFDTVIVDCARIFEPEEETLQRLLYVNCTRARKRLYLRYAGEPPEILQRFYSDFRS